MVFYAPVLFSSLGMGQDAALLSSVITGAVFVGATIISILTVDTFGRRVRLFLTLQPLHALSMPHLSSEGSLYLCGSGGDIVHPHCGHV